MNSITTGSEGGEAVCVWVGGGGAEGALFSYILGGREAEGAGGVSNEVFPCNTHDGLAVSSGRVCRKLYSKHPLIIWGKWGTLTRAGNSSYFFNVSRVKPFYLRVTAVLFYLFPASLPFCVTH